MSRQNECVSSDGITNGVFIPGILNREVADGGMPSGLTQRNFQRIFETGHLLGHGIRTQNERERDIMNLDMNTGDGPLGYTKYRRLDGQDELFFEDDEDQRNRVLAHLVALRG